MKSRWIFSYEDILILGLIRRRFRNWKGSFLAIPVRTFPMESYQPNWRRSGEGLRGILPEPTCLFSRESTFGQHMILEMKWIIFQPKGKNIMIYNFDESRKGSCDTWGVPLVTVSDCATRSRSISVWVGLVHTASTVPAPGLHGANSARLDTEPTADTFHSLELVYHSTQEEELIIST